MSRLRILPVLIILSALTLPLLAQVDTAWVRRYNGPVSYSSDYPHALAVDDSGNVYVTGQSTGSGTSYDYATIKYAPNGDTLWVRRYNDSGNDFDAANALALDGSGNLYVTGYSWSGIGTSIDYATIKYSPAGETLWVRRYSGPGSHYDYANALALDTSGNLYVTGQSDATGANWDYATVKYSPAGETLWSRRYNGPGNAGDVASALAVDNSGNVYVTGRSRGSGTFDDYATIKYAPNGDTLWVRRYNGPGNYDDGALALAVDSSGNLYVTGFSNGGGTSTDYATIKYAPNGDTLWVRRYNDGADYASALAMDNAGNVYVTGGSGVGTSDYATIKYAPNGDTLWVRRYKGPGNSDDYANALALDTAGNLYVTGQSWGSGTFNDYATVKYSPSGDTLWVRRYNGPVNDYDNATALAVDNSGNLYVTGSSYGSGTNFFDYATIKYSSCSAIPGDVNASGTITLGDIVHLLNYVFDRDKPPCIGIDPGNCWNFGLTCRGDVNNSASITLGDIVHLLNYVFDRDNPPCIGTDPGNCWTPVASGACCQPVP